jgi:hypothetical protein
VPPRHRETPDALYLLSLQCQARIRLEPVSNRYTSLPDFFARLSPSAGQGNICNRSQHRLPVCLPQRYSSTIPPNFRLAFSTGLLINLTSTYKFSRASDNSPDAASESPGSLCSFATFVAKILARSLSCRSLGRSGLHARPCRWMGDISMECQRCAKSSQDNPTRRNESE